MSEQELVRLINELRKSLTEEQKLILVESILDYSVMETDNHGQYVLYTDVWTNPDEEF